jgi:hypothetical protein
MNIKIILIQKKLIVGIGSWDLHNGHGHGPWIWTCTIEIDMHHGDGHSAWTMKCTMDMDSH